MKNSETNPTFESVKIQTLNLFKETLMSYIKGEFFNEDDKKNVYVQLCTLEKVLLIHGMTKDEIKEIVNIAHTYKKTKRVAVEIATGNEYFIVDENEKTFKVVHTNRVRGNVYKTGFEVKAVSSDYELPKLK